MTENDSSAVAAFENREVDVKTLPDMMAVSMQPISPRYRWLNLTVAVAAVVIVSAILSFFRYQSFMAVPFGLERFYTMAIVVVCTLGALSFIYHLLADKKIKYCLREQDLVMQHGLIFRKIACQPILRIQHIELKRGPLDRVADLACLQVFSAGGAMHTFEIPGLRLTDAQKVRQYILNHKELDAK
ncbi:PH domain-containing protein [Salinimonas sp. HHU 13199]|uniref:PH domain-containing protein n=1 Tax=Salinimonas profundi TaxID=2729140 RepID=A0ABR8LK95_9ALTE|nr:PH domain-containing protein [Salinimonas profundi]MBD3586177.1 PH domain-containing protein [Salinimonas profundi]